MSLPTPDGPSNTALSPRLALANASNVGLAGSGVPVKSFQVMRPDAPCSPSSKHHRHSAIGYRLPMRYEQLHREQNEVEFVGELPQNFLVQPCPCRWQGFCAI
jgi:hypothetical protein